MKSYKKSKKAYLFFLLITLGVATYDQLRPRPEHVQIVLENEPKGEFFLDFIAKSN